MSGPLHGIVVLDLTRILAGPWATQLMADYGAYVIKVENPAGGDDTRHWGPPWLRDAEGRETHEAAYYAATNRGKRSIAVDLAQAEGRQIVRRLAMQADVLVENFKVGGLAAFGLADRDLRPLNPRLIYLSISAFGQDGPRAAEPGYDAMIQGLGGLMSITGVADGEPGAGPQKVGVAVADLMCGMYATTAILAALEERHRSGCGQYIDLSLLDSQVAWLANQGLNYFVTGRAPQRLGTAHPNIVPYQAFAASDGYLMLAVGNDAQFARFCQVAGLDELATDTRFATNRARIAHRLELTGRLTSVFTTRRRDDWLAALRAAQVPCGPINDLAQVFADPQVVHRGLRIDLEQPSGTMVPGVRQPMLFARTPLRYERAPPALGADTDAVLRERLGFDAPTLERLRAARVIA
jgi:crotonobetainyl-CoA:carnitine CoA-transferase CaiB-like acyl-CoA transferase